MPTVYTYDIIEDSSFTNFALHCAEAFVGVFNKDKLTKGISEKASSSLFESDLEQSIESLNKLLKSSQGDLSIQFVQERIKFLEYTLKTFKETEDLRCKYNYMRQKTIGWDCGKEFETLKSFMIKQLDESIEQDCDKLCQMLLETLSVLPPTFSEWFDRKSSNLSEDIKHYRELVNQNKKDTEKTNNWINNLRKSLKEYESR